MTLLFGSPTTSTVLNGMCFVAPDAMPLKPALLKKLAGTFPPNTLVPLRFKGLDAAVRIGPDGLAWQLFLGKLDHTGRIRGERYVRTYKTDAEGQVLKDHWDLKGRAS
jgi:hypothetical protein